MTSPADIGSGSAAPPRSRRGLRPLRRLHAAGAALLYALCALLVPALHLAWHRPDHDHAGGGLHLGRATLVAQGLAGPLAAHRPHRHDGAEHTHEPAQVPPRVLLAQAGTDAPRAPAPTWAAPTPAGAEPLDGLRHGLGSLSHFGGACLHGLAPPVVPAAAPAVLLAPSLAPPSRLLLRPRDRATGARAPPCSARSPLSESIC